MTTNKFKFLGKDFDKQNHSTEIESQELSSVTSDEQDQSKSNQQEAKTITKSFPLNKIRETKDPSTLQSKKNNQEKPGKRNNPDYKTVGILLPKKLHKQAKVLLMDDEQERDFSDLMTELLEQWLKEKEA